MTSHRDEKTIAHYFWTCDSLILTGQRRIHRSETSWLNKALFQECSRKTLFGWKRILNDVLSQDFWWTLVQCGWMIQYSWEKNSCQSLIRDRYQLIVDSVIRVETSSPSFWQSYSFKCFFVGYIRCSDFGDVVQPRVAAGRESWPTAADAGTRQSAHPRSDHFNTQRKQGISTQAKQYVYWLIVRGCVCVHVCVCMRSCVYVHLSTSRMRLRDAVVEYWEVKQSRLEGWCGIHMFDRLQTLHGLPLYDMSCSEVWWLAGSEAENISIE